MLTNCNNCSAEMEDDEVNQCPDCGEDGLCADCLHPDDHNCDAIEDEE